MGNQKQTNVCRNQFENKKKSNNFYAARQNAKIDTRSLRKVKCVNKFSQERRQLFYENYHISDHFVLVKELRYYRYSNLINPSELFYSSIFWIRKKAVISMHIFISIQCFISKIKHFQCPKLLELFVWTLLPTSARTTLGIKASHIRFA